MTAAIVLQRRADDDWSLPFRPLESVQDPEALLERIRRCPGQVRWIAIAPDLEDPTAIAGRIREADPSIGVVLLAEDGDSGAFFGERTEQARAVTALRRERAYVRSLLHSVDAAVLLIAQDGTLLEWNRRAESLYGVSREEALGRLYADFVPEAERERIDAEIRRVAGGGKPTENFEIAVCASQGVRHVLWSAALVDDEAGESAVLATGVDITDRKHTEPIPRETQRRTLEMEELASITALTAVLAHDMATPMTAILGYAELLAKSVDDEKNRKRATTIVEQVHRVSDLIETLVSLSRTEERPPIPLELSGILDRALDCSREKLEQCGIEVQREYAPAPRVLGDPDRLHQLLRILLLDTVDAMSQGGTIRVSLAVTAAAEVEVRLSWAGTGTGSGLRTQITEPDSSARQPSGGTGLGLRVARTIVEEHGGRITFISEPERGTELRLTFPQLPEPAP
jgi:PAS domain S-box-containing protein